jgi:hypothetical protein
MNEDTSIIHFRQPDEVDDPLTALLRSGARRLLEQTIAAEVEASLASKKDLKLADGRDRLVRHGHGVNRRRLRPPIGVRVTLRRACEVISKQRLAANDPLPIQGHSSEPNHRPVSPS